MGEQIYRLGFKLYNNTGENKFQINCESVDFMGIEKATGGGFCDLSPKNDFEMRFFTLIGHNSIHVHYYQNGLINNE